ncbi:iron-siderophore ABC transporter substrate-binding protein [Leucobacter sp. M11]|uniref:iron-siderophore ABC transporter substrate-binding protein n=1 Tax=Leucobacter sp. M11 TaxID=2993565 RepID=UPI002D80B2CA|nr:iron-siderophore ABC transporter substrate-binding protein [Leucobacter sp. M11]MEB4615696.1 iron-siderophore ABC transporter substrate-binding protein [Leucobacter sp. M11]
MQFRTTTRRSRLTALAAATALSALVLAGCSAPADENASDSDRSAEGFPVTMTHALGETVIPEKPERVVTIGWMTQDLVAGLGIAPVGTTAQWGGDDNGHTPWFKEQVTEVLGEELPADITYDDAGEINFEQILELDPDVILAPHSGVSEVEYERLSEIAPVVAYEKQTWASGPWQDLTRTVATALGESELAEEKIAETEALLAEARESHPEFEGVTFVYGMGVRDGATDFGVYVESDPRVRFLTELGLSNTTSMSDILGTVAGDDWFGAVSLEQLDTLKADVFIGWANDEAEIQETLTHPMVSRWAPVANGKALMISDPEMGMATNSPTILSVPWALPTFLPMLADTVAGQETGK